jgi:N-methylhydantoinase B
MEGMWRYDGIDRVTLRVIGGAFNTIAREMAQMLYRMSNSSIIRESEDLGCGLYDALGNELCESESSPMHIGSLPAYIRGFMRKLAGQLHEGDIIIHNHPYHGASHSPDLAVVAPMFHGGELIGFAAATAHLIDSGAAAPGLNVDLIDVFAEGTLYDSIKLYERGIRNEAVWSILRDSVRTPDANAADIEAMIAAVRTGAERFARPIDKHGRETVMGAAHYWMDYSERRLRAEIARIPDGDYHAESWLDDDGRNWGKPLKVNVTVKKRGDSILIDLTGSADEVETGYNVPFEGSLQVACYYIVRTLLLDEVMTEEFIPQNSGMFRPVSVHAPKGSIFNPHFPRACSSRMAQVQRVLDCVIRALAPVLPERATAGNSAHVMSVSYSGYSAERQQYWVCVEVNEGSYGARRTKDGLDAVDNLMANTRNVPCEEIEMRFPLRVERYELRPDSPGAGEQRGGIGAVREVRFLADGFLSCNGDRTLEAPKGIFGGTDGLPAQIVKNPGGPDEERLPSKSTGRRLKAGDVIRIVGPNAGGYGNPMHRDPQRVATDVADGLISAQTAHDVYGVVLDSATGTVDQAATARLRAT